MAKKSRKPVLSQAQKRDIKRLREKGVYKPKDARKAPTRHAKGLLVKFADLLRGKAKIVTVKGARRFAAGDKPGTVRAVRGKLVVPAQEGEQVRYSKKTGKVRVTRRVGRATYVRELFSGMRRTVEDVLRQLKPGDRVAVPFYRGRFGTEWLNMTEDEFRAFIAEYRERYKGVLNFVEAFRYEGPRTDAEEDL